MEGYFLKEILIVHTGQFDINGISEMIKNFCEYLQENKNIHVTICTNGKKINEKYEKFFKEKNILIIKTTSKQKSLIKYYIDLKKISQRHYDIVHIHGNSGMMAIEVSAFRKNSNIIITHIHNNKTDYPLIEQFLKLYVNKRVDIRYAASLSAGNNLYGNLKFSVIPNGIDINQFKFSLDQYHIIRKQLAISSECEVLIHVGRFSNQKNHIFLLKIFKELLKNNKKRILILLGDGELREQVSEYAKKNHIIDNIVFLGNKIDIFNYYNIADLFILPSLYEAFPVTLIEAQANGLQCIVSSESVGKEVDISDSVVFESLMKKPYEWCREVEKLLDSKRTASCRIKINNDLSNSIYDRGISYKQIETDYLND